MERATPSLLTSFPEWHSESQEVTTAIQRHADMMLTAKERLVGAERTYLLVVCSTACKFSYSDFPGHGHFVLPFADAGSWHFACSPATIYAGIFVFFSYLQY